MGSLSGGSKVIKYLVFIFNFLFFLMGIGMMALGIYAKVGNSKYIDLSEEFSDKSEYFTAGNLLIAVGVIVLVIAFFGCCGAVNENPCMLLIFFIFLVLIFILELAACIIGYTKRSDVESVLDQEFKQAITNKYISNNSTKSGIVKAVDAFQEEFQCCGYDGYLDWRQSAYHNSTNQIPASCCKKGANSCPTTDPALLPVQYNTKGCLKEFTKWFKDNMYAIGSAAIAFAIIQVLGIVFSMMLYCSIQRAGEVA